MLAPADRPINRGEHRSDAYRIINLPVEDERSDDLTDLLFLTKPPITLKHGQVVHGLTEIQSRFLSQVAKYQGGLGAIGVGHGKSFIALLAGTVLGSDLSIILTPPRPLKQLQRTLAEMREHFKLPRRIEIVSYSILQRQSTLLDDLVKDVPDKSRVVLVADESQCLKNLKAASTQRVVRLLTDNPDIRFVAMSGTLQTSSIKDTAHLAELALRDFSCYPTDDRTLSSWAECLDEKGQPGPDEWRALKPLMLKYDVPDSVRGEARRKAARQAFQQRLSTAPGVVATNDASCAAPLIVEAVSFDVPLLIKEHLARIEDERVGPDGEILVDPIEVWRAARYVSAGFYYETMWPDGQVDEDWIEAKRGWDRAVRHELEHRSGPNYDSPANVEARVRKHLEVFGPNNRLTRVLALWDEQRVKPPPPKRTVWLSDYYFRECVEWAKSQNVPMILWYESEAAQEALSKLLKTYLPGENVPEGARAELCAMSYKSQGTGLDLPQWSVNFFVEMPAPSQFEQAIGRTHRKSQKADEVLVYVAQHTSAYCEALESARRAAAANQDVLGNQMKLVIASYTF